MKYVFTKSLKRSERANIARKIYIEIEKQNGIIHKSRKNTVKILKEKKRKEKFDKSIIPYVVGNYSLKGVDFYIITNRTEGFDVVFKTSPIDAGFVEYIRVLPDCKGAILYTQHSLDRYNQRICNLKHTTYKEMLLAIIIENPIKGIISRDKEDTTKVVQRINSGFLLGNISSEDENLVIFNTFYDSEEYKDSDMKSRTRAFNDKKNLLTNAQINDYDELLHKHLIGELSLNELERQMTLKGYN
jgi:hypothetical protein